MEQLVIKKSDMEKWFEALKTKASVMGPKPKGSSFVFGPVGSLDEMSLTYLPTIIPPKKYYFPPREALVEFKRNPKGWTILNEGAARMPIAA